MFFLPPKPRLINSTPFMWLGQTTLLGGSEHGGNKSFPMASCFYVERNLHACSGKQNPKVLGSAPMEFLPFDRQKGWHWRRGEASSSSMGFDAPGRRSTAMVHGRPCTSSKAAFGFSILSSIDYLHFPNRKRTILQDRIHKDMNTNWIDPHRPPSSNQQLV